MWRRSDSGSISAPAKKVSGPEPKVARKSIQGVVWKPRKLPPITPIPILISATETPSLRSGWRAAPSHPDGRDEPHVVGDELREHPAVPPHQVFGANKRPLARPYRSSPEPSALAGGSDHQRAQAGSIAV